MKGDTKTKNNLVISLGLTLVAIALVFGPWMPFLFFAFFLLIGFGLQWIGREFLYEEAYKVGYRDGFGDAKGWTDTKGERKQA